MANTVTTRNLQDDAKYLVTHIYLKSDGAAGELVNQVVVDPTAVTFVDNWGTPNPPKLTLLEIWYCMTGFDSLLKFDAATPVPFWKMAGQQPGGEHNDFTYFGGIKDNSGAGSTGKITLDTAGFTTVTDEGTIILRFRKN